MRHPVALQNISHMLTLPATPGGPVEQEETEQRIMESQHRPMETRGVELSAKIRHSQKVASLWKGGRPYKEGH